MIFELLLFLFVYFLINYFVLVKNLIIDHNRAVFFFLQLAVFFIYLLFIGTRPVDFVSDTERYIEWFNNVKKLSSLDSAMNIYTDHTGMTKDRFFSAFLYILSGFMDESNHLIWLFPLMIVCLLLFIGIRHFRHRSDILLFSLLLFFNRMYLDYSLNQFRSSVVFLLIILILYYFYEKRNRLVVFMLCILFLVHSKAVLLSFIAYLISFLNATLLLIALYISILIYFFPETISAFIYQALDNLLQYRLSFFKSENILNTFNEELFSLNFYIQLFLFIAFPLFLLIFKFKEISHNRLHFVYLKIAISSLLLFFLLFNFIPEIYRLFQLIIPILFILLLLYKKKVITLYIILLLIINSITFSKNIIELDFSVYNFLISI